MRLQTLACLLAFGGPIDQEDLPACEPHYAMNYGRAVTEFPGLFAPPSSSSGFELSSSPQGTGVHRHYQLSTYSSLSNWSATKSTPQDQGYSPPPVIQDRDEDVTCRHTFQRDEEDQPLQTHPPQSPLTQDVKDHDEQTHGLFSLAPLCESTYAHPLPSLFSQYSASGPSSAASSDSPSPLSLQDLSPGLGDASPQPVSPPEWSLTPSMDSEDLRMAVQEQLFEKTTAGRDDQQSYMGLLVGGMPPQLDPEFIHNTNCSTLHKGEIEHPQNTRCHGAVEASLYASSQTTSLERDEVHAEKPGARHVRTVFYLSRRRLMLVSFIAGLQRTIGKCPIRSRKPYKMHKQTLSPMPWATTSTMMADLSLRPGRGSLSTKHQSWCLVSLQMSHPRSHICLIHPFSPTNPHRLPCFLRFHSTQERRLCRSSKIRRSVSTRSLKNHYRRGGAKKVGKSQVPLIWLPCRTHLWSRPPASTKKIW